MKAIVTASALLRASVVSNLPGQAPRERDIARRFGRIEGVLASRAAAGRQP